ncbi:MAG: DUF3386 domain-containing protein [Gloeocapsa sp. UFS-A4-WI-NPMV-4B04]|jgi:hypothetical protein|nr:DUF3386 domain-containing protein [Gloeocapsa sp. UFS-A4-WI-NPMV-4B04]
MNRQSKLLIPLSLSLIVIFASLEWVMPTTAQAVDLTDVVLISEKTDLTSAISAHNLFRAAYQNRYTWDSQFPGYTATVEIRQGEDKYQGRIRLNPDLSVEVTGIDDQNARQAVENQLAMIAIHRRQVPFEVAHKNSTFKLGATDKIGAVKIFQQAENTKANFKVLRQQILQVNRNLGPHSVTVDTLDTELTPEGYLATHYRTVFRNPQLKEVVGEMESKDTYKKIGGYYVLTRQIINMSEQGKRSTIELNFSDITPLSG